MKKNLFSTNKGYIYCNGKVQALTIESYIFHANGDITLLGKLGGKEWQTSEDSMDNVSLLYPTEEDCVNNTNPVAVTSVYINSLDNFIGNEYNHPSCYVPTTNGAKRIDDIDSLDLRINIKVADNGRITYNGIFEGYGKVYENLTFYNADNDVEVIEEDGTSHIRKALTSRIKLTDEQAKVFQNLCDALKACRDAKIGLYRQSWKEGLYAINKADEGLEFTSYTDEWDEYINVKDFVEPFMEGIQPFGDDHCDGIFIREKKNN